MTEIEQSVDSIRIEHAKGHVLRWSPGDVGILLRLLDECDAKIAYYETEYQDEASMSMLREQQGFLQAEIARLQEERIPARSAMAQGAKGADGSFYPQANLPSHASALERARSINFACTRSSCCREGDRLGAVIMDREAFIQNAASVITAALEEAAKIAEDMPIQIYQDGETSTFDGVASAIRLLANADNQH